MYLPDINSLRLLTSLPNPIEEFIVAGYFASGDGGGGTFTWVDISVTPPMLIDDSGIIICTQSLSNPLYNSGYFKRLYSGSVNVRWFGAKGDGSTDDTAAVHKARDSQFTRDGGTIFFPKGIYIGAFEFSAAQGEVNILGEGMGSVLKANNNNNPVLTLGWRTLIQRKSKVYNLTIDGNEKNAVGVLFDDTTFNSMEGRFTPEYSGKWSFENVTFQECQKGVFKPTGNIDNTFTNCIFIQNTIGYYAESVATMHSGCDKFIGGFIGETDIAGIYVKSEGLYGQLIIDGTIMEANYGFAIFIKMNNEARMTFNGIEIRNVWMENNAKNPTTNIDTISYNTRELYFEGVRSMSIYQNRISDIVLIASSVNLHNCKSDDYHTRTPWLWPYRIEVDANSSILANELRYESTVSENIFVNSISYDGSADIRYDSSKPTSVWGPLRVCMVSGIDNLLFSSGILADPIAEIWPGYGGLPEVHAIDNLNAGTMISYYNSLVNNVAITCKDMTLNPNDIVQSPSSFMVRDKYYFWSIHTYQCGEGTVTGYFGAEPSDAPENARKLGQVILKKGQWACAYGIKKLNLEEEEEFHLWFFGNSNGGKFRFCHYQVLAFDNLYDAQSYAKSRAFAIYGELCERGEIQKTKILP